MFITVLGLLIVLAAAWYIVAPLLDSSPGSVQAGENAQTADLLDRRATLYREIADLDFDYRTGKVVGADYHEQREQYLAEAAIVLRALDEQSVVPEDVDYTRIDAEIEREVQELRIQEKGR